jgi:hypothetical protein
MRASCGRLAGGVKAPCPCGCGLEVPRRAHNHWAHKEPYWEWVCVNPECEVHQSKMRNQSGERACSWCGRPRFFVGHYLQGGSKNGFDREKVTGGAEKRAQAHHLIYPTPAWAIKPWED